MKEQEAIKIIDSILDGGMPNVVFPPKTKTALMEAAMALNRDTPKTPNLNQKGTILGTSYYTCPTCGNCYLTEFVNERQVSYCWDCGQKLDWYKAERVR